ncbi:LpxL/LpxP family acyltransferase [Chitinolyticbacter meiyuanensis]|uniref:LpxL/LpxP family acyltransferase n=1 Tax=Chitinolyticbacter meiyuanensis TaxID=682798 RepID=UPI0011E5D1D3|nr:acyltransferase [Chitinolyticbacter meiyuanensis]
MSRQSSSRHWAQMGENTFVFGTLLLFWIYRILGRWPFRFCLLPVVFVQWLCQPVLRASSLQYLSRLQQATGALGRDPDWRDSLRHAWLFAETMLDKLLAVSGRYREADVRIVGGEVVYQAALAGQGAVIVTAHLGCLELCRVLGERRPGFKLNVLVHTRHAVRFNQLLKRLNPNNELTLLQVTEIGPATALLLAEKLAAGECIAIAGDRIPVAGGRTVTVDFLGHPAPFPIGPYVLASLLKCPLYLLGCIHEGRGYAAHFECLAERIVLPRQDRESALQRYAAGYAAAVTALLQRSPYDWFNFFAFWDQAHDVRSN